MEEEEEDLSEEGATMAHELLNTRSI